MAAPKTTRPGSPHDRLVKTVFSLPRFAAQLFPLARDPARLAALDPQTLVPVNSEVVDERLRAQIPDLLFRAQRRGTSHRAFLLFEHRSNGARWLILRLLRDARAVLDHERRRAPDQPLPPVLPLIFFPGPGPWHWPTTLRELLDLPPEDDTGLGPLHEADVVELACHDRASLCALPGPALGRMAFVTLKCVREGGDLCEAWRDSADVVAAALEEEDGTEALTELFVYAELVLGEAVMGKLRDQTERHHGEPASRTFATAGERLLAEGAAREARSILERLLTAKFGPLSQAFLARLDVASLEQLNGCIDRVGGAGSLEDVFE